MDIFKTIRANRIAALALAKQRRDTEFSPFRCKAIDDARFTLKSLDRGELVLTLGDQQEIILPNFYERHAQRLLELSGQARIDFLKDIWLNYNAWRYRNVEERKT